MIALGLRCTSLGIATLMVADSSPFALWGVVITSAASLLAQIIKNRDDARRAEREHRFAVEDRKATELARSLLTKGLAENTELTRKGNEAAGRAYDTANHVNEKIAAIAAQALATDRTTAAESVAAIRRDIAALSAKTPPEDGTDAGGGK